MVVHCGNRYLSLQEMTDNAQYIMNYLNARGWSKNAIAGMLGNMQTESTINPCIWQNLDAGNMKLGYGLVQWTPATNYTNWADARGYAWNDINGQLERFQFEMDNGLQWIKTTDYPLSFQEFKTSTKSPEYLAQAFLRNYERPANQNQPNRSTQARHWFDTLSGDSTGGTNGKPAFPVMNRDYPTEISSRYGWRLHPIENIMKFHTGIDISANGLYLPILATQKGVVIYNGWIAGGGWTVQIQHTGDTYSSMYMHLNDRAFVEYGDQVEKGQFIGVMGSTGDSTGVHLHFEIAKHPNGFHTEEGTIDPLLYLEMGFGEEETPKNDINKNIVTLLLVDALNGWKW